MTNNNITTESFRGFDLRYVELNLRLNNVKREFGLRRAISTHSLTGETRTFAEILDQEVETIVLFYLEVQGILAKQLRIIRENQIKALQDCAVTLGIIEDMCRKYREVGLEVLELLNYLDRNSVALRKILHRHDVLFDQKMSSIYFDSRLSGHSKSSQLRQLYHQEGVRAVVASIRRGFEELYDARKALLDTFDSIENDEDSSPLLGHSFDERIFHQQHDKLNQAKVVPKVPFRKRLASYSNLQKLVKESNSASMTENSGKTLRNRAHSTGNMLTLKERHESIPSGESIVRKRSLSDLEPILQRITNVANRLVKTQNKTTMEYLSSHSAMGLELSMRDLVQRDLSVEQEAEALNVNTSLSGLYINLFLTFLYLANQYVVAPTSGEYARMLGMSSSASGLIIGLAPAASLASSLLYSMWSNYSFKSPLLVSIICGVLGNLLYGAALQCGSIEMLFIGRLLTGFGGTRVISRRYIVDHVSLKDRLLASTQFVTAGALGLAAGPLIASFIDKTNLTFELKSSVLNKVLIHYENVTAPGWIMALLWFFSYFLVLFLFIEPELKNSVEIEKPKTVAVSEKYGTFLKEDVVHVESGSELWLADSSSSAKPDTEYTKPAPTVLNSTNDIDLTERHVLNDHPSWYSKSVVVNTETTRTIGCFDYISAEVYVLLFVYAVIKMGQELAISSMPFITRQLFFTSNEICGYYMASIGGLVLPVTVAINQISKDSEERDMVLRMTEVTILGIILICHFGLFGEYSLFQYLCGSAIIFTALNATEGIVMSLLSKVISPELARGTFNSGLLATEAGTFGRVMGDLAITLLGDQTNVNAALVNRLYSPLLIMLLVGLFVVQFFHERLTE